MKLSFYTTIFRGVNIKEDIINWLPAIQTEYNHDNHYFCIIFTWLIFAISLEINK